ncbi:MAG TPA: nitronate monooxygenase [Puia sp.]|jgi:nitronate monooxygenase
MWYNTKAAKILGVQYPIFQGPFGGNLSSVKLTSTVSNLGGVGGYGAYTLTPQEIYNVNEEIRKETSKPYNINLWVSDNDLATSAGNNTTSPPGKSNDPMLPDTTTPRATNNPNPSNIPPNPIPSDLQSLRALFQSYFDELGVPFPDKPLSFSSRFENQVEVILHTKPPAFSFMFGVPSADILGQCKKLGIVTIGAATTLDEALALDDADVDMIIASGFEAGGHRPSFLAPSENSLTGTFVLLQQIRETVRRPIIAAGGIATGKGIAAALALGADAVQVGTAFLACEESNALDIHREMLFSPASRYTVLTRAFTGRLGRGLRSRISEETRGKEKSFLPFPLQSQFMSSLRQAAIIQKKWELILFWGGQIAPLLKHKKASDLMNALVEETTAYFNGLTTA